MHNQYLQTDRLMEQWMDGQTELVQRNTEDTEELCISAFQGTCNFYALLREMPYCQCIDLKEKASRNLEFMLL